VLAPGLRLSSVENREIDGRSDPSPSTLHRIVTFVSAVSLLGLAFNSWGAIVPLPAVGAVAMTSFLAVLVMLAVAVTTTSRRSLVRVDTAVLVVGLALLAATSIANLYGNPGYGTDEAAFEQYAATLLVHGHDPYGSDLLRALTLYRVPIQYATSTLGGGTVSTFGYPDVSILVAAAFTWLTGGVQSVIVADLVALGISVVVSFALLPRELRSLAVLAGVGVPILQGYAESGVNAILLVPPLMLAVARWSSIGRSGRLSGRGVLQAASLGVAVSIQQLAWFLLPFLVVSLWRNCRAGLDARRATRVTVAFVAIVLAVFVTLDLPFIVVNARLWFDGVIAPLVQHAIPYGQGLVDLSIFFRLGGGDLGAYSAGTVLVYLAALCAFATWYPRLRQAMLILPVVVLFFPTRSLAEYLMSLSSVWLVLLATSEELRADATVVRVPGAAPSHERHSVPPPLSFPPSSRPSEPGHRRRLVLATISLCSAGALLLFIRALATRGPLEIRIRSVTTNGQLRSVWSLEVRVTNTSAIRLRPSFAPNAIGQATTFWNQIGGPSAIAPHATAVYRLAAANIGSMPSLTTPFELEAFTESPDTISSSTLFTPSAYSAYVTPPYVDRVLPLGGSVVLRVELRSPFGAVVHRGGVDIALGQIIYAQGAEIASEAVINGRDAGMSPVTARTSAAGVATFHVSDDSYQANPVYFQAWIQPAGGYPFGYSEIVSVVWVPRQRHDTRPSGHGRLHRHDLAGPR
jgi:uncharacterized membrane protein